MRLVFVVKISRLWVRDQVMKHFDFSGFPVSGLKGGLRLRVLIFLGSNTGFLASKSCLNVVFLKNTNAQNTNIYSVITE